MRDPPLVHQCIMPEQRKSREHADEAGLRSIIGMMTDAQIRCQAKNSAAAGNKSKKSARVPIAEMRGCRLDPPGESVAQGAHAARGAAESRLRAGSRLAERSMARAARGPNGGVQMKGCVPKIVPIEPIGLRGRGLRGLLLRAPRQQAYRSRCRLPLGMQRVTTSRR